MPQVWLSCDGRGTRYCAEHHLPPRGTEYASARRHVLAQAIVCHLCGKPGTLTDRLVADHLVPRVSRGAGIGPGGELRGDRPGSVSNARATPQSVGA